MLRAAYRSALGVIVVFTASVAAAQAPPPPKSAAPAPAAATAETLDEEVDRTLRSLPLFDTMSEVDPEGYAIARKILKEAVLTKPAPGVVMKQAGEVFLTRTRRYILGGGDEEVIMYYQGFADRLEAVGKVNAADCARIAMGLPGVSPETMKDPEVAKHFAMGMIPVMLLLESNKGRTQATYSAAQDAERVVTLAALLVSVARSETDFDAWMGGTAAARDPARTCEVHTALYRAIMERPQAEAADLLRFLTYRRK